MEEEPPAEEPVEEEPPTEEPVEEEPPVEEPKHPTPPKKKKKNVVLFVVLGIVVVATIIGFALSNNDSVDIPNPPYIDENGNVDWDKKFQNEKNK